MRYKRYQTPITRLVKIVTGSDLLDAVREIVYSGLRPGPACAKRSRDQPEYQEKTYRTIRQAVLKVKAREKHGNEQKLQVTEEGLVKQVLSLRENDVYLLELFRN